MLCWAGQNNLGQVKALALSFDCILSFASNKMLNLLYKRILSLPSSVYKLVLLHFPSTGYVKKCSAKCEKVATLRKAGLGMIPRVLDPHTSGQSFTGSGTQLPCRDSTESFSFKGADLPSKPTNHLLREPHR